MGGWVGEQIEDAVDFVTDDIPEFVEEEIIDPVGDFLGNVGDALGDVVDFVDDAIQNPYVRAVASFVYPPAAPYLNAYAKLDSGEDLTAGDLAALGVSAYSDLSGLEIDPQIAKAVNTGTQLAEGADPVSALVSNYGADFAKELGLADQLKTSMSSVLGDDAVSFVDKYMDVNQAAADIVAGEDTNRILANQFGDEIATYVGSGDPNLTALGYAGIESGIALDNGEDQADALMAGAKEYYDRGGQLPDVGQLAGLTGIDAGEFDWNRFLPEVDFQAPEFLAQGYDWLKERNIDFGQVPDLFKGFNAPDINMDFGQFADLGGSLGDLNWQGVDWQNTGYDLGELKDMGVDLSQLNMGDFTLPQALGMVGVAQQLADENIDPEEEEVVSLDSPFDKEEEGPLFSRQILGSTPIV